MEYIRFFKSSAACPQTESTSFNTVVEKTLGRASTIRGVNTIRKMAARYAV
jgi:hypothetical protein